MKRRGRKKEREKERRKEVSCRTTQKRLGLLHTMGRLKKHLAPPTFYILPAKHIANSRATV
jgi:hypothetical protein